MAKQQDRSTNTRSALLAAYRQSLLTRGLKGTTTDLVLAEAGLSKGAMYHHFRSKNEIIEALYDKESRDTIAQAFDESDRDRSALDRLKASCLAWLEATKDSSVSAILFEIGPTALGSDHARQIEDRHGVAQIRRLLEEAREEGEATFDEIDLTAAFINSLVAQAALHGMRTGTDTYEHLADAMDALLAYSAGYQSNFSI